MLWDGVGYACKIDGRMDKELYVKILDKDLEASLKYYGKFQADIIFQQDNNSKHTSHLATNWLEDYGYEVLEWPAQSPDLNPIEHLWTHLKHKLAKYQKGPKGMLELWERVEKEWDAIDTAVCQNLIESMPRRIDVVIKDKGGHIKY